MNKTDKLLVNMVRNSLNSKHIIRHTNVNNNIRSNLFHIRNLPENLRHGIQLYKFAVRKVDNKLASTNESWLTDYRHYRELNEMEFHGSGKLTNYIDTYLERTKESYVRQNEDSTVELNEKLKVLTNKYPSFDFSQIKKKRSHERTGDEVQFYSDYKTITDNHVPIIRTLPGTRNFDYLARAIRLISSNQTILFSFDIEAFERDNNVVTEIGISIYDPRENQVNFTGVNVLKNYHLIVSESLSLRNRRWVCDLKDCYLLNESFVMNLNQCIEFVQSLINYYMIPGENDTWKRALVGHNIDGDIKWLRDLGVKMPQTELGTELSQDTKDVMIMDTMKLYKYCYGDKGSSLGKLLRLFQIPHAFLHNAGNDAYYTLNLLLYMTNINFRQQFGLDNFKSINEKIIYNLNRKNEPKILPMSYSIVNRNTNNSKKDLIPQTEFGGSKWFPNATSAFESTQHQES
ncbi:hypothetical protein KAFR_0D04160 [Kazachstania africana CBS 2517]|uniref:Gfd2/YDR514C-like C-terminal domain-containing protein n=1 Tax=Kazachstania africana (strain ATCC 22294 / BCRC 22015 / CBS 2517 / CECT 1963 / NBRC 1671 / NRRL Y-8276) TaxID=1071382 RepID=H2AUL4_KAZAF|nr:hypothetical protein KAFR_0D04160 [Kazachstania africana CBS 2517]CCF58064.1 hypothetical protein KAFR_0D04160 [Kazachstania africana CBS 2517]